MPEQNLCSVHVDGLYGCSGVMESRMGLAGAAGPAEDLHLSEAAAALVVLTGLC